MCTGVTVVLTTGVLQFVLTTGVNSRSAGTGITKVKKILQIKLSVIKVN